MTNNDASYLVLDIINGSYITAAFSPLTISDYSSFVNFLYSSNSEIPIYNFSITKWALLPLLFTDLYNTERFITLVELKTKLENQFVPIEIETEIYINTYLKEKF